MPETHIILKYALIAFFVLFGIAVVGHIVKHGVSFKLPDASKPIFAKPDPERDRRDFVEDLVIGGAMIVMILLATQCTEG